MSNQSSSEDGGARLSAAPHPRAAATGGDDDAPEPERCRAPDPAAASAGDMLRLILKPLAALRRKDDAMKPDQQEDNAPPSALEANLPRLEALRVSDAMVPRADIVALEESAGLPEVLETFRKAKHSRLPVYRETLDDALGFIHVKDLLLTYGFDAPEPDRPFRLRDHLRTALYVPPSMSAGALLRRMQAGRVHMALVIDEFGGVDGLATFEDVVELIVGDIEDEHDEDASATWSQTGEGVYICDARAPLIEFEAETGVTLLVDSEDEEVDTLGGLIFTLCRGRVPQRGEVIIHPDGHEFTILDVDPRRIKRLSVTLAGHKTAARPNEAPPVAQGETDL